MRSVSGGLPAIAHTQASQTWGDSGQRTRFWPVNVAPAHRSWSIPRQEVPAHTQQRKAGKSAQSATRGDPVMVWRR